jgi:hypothetical protein
LENVEVVEMVAEGDAPMERVWVADCEGVIVLLSVGTWVAD